MEDLITMTTMSAAYPKARGPIPSDSPTLKLQKRDEREARSLADLAEVDNNRTEPPSAGAWLGHIMLSMVAALTLSFFSPGWLLSAGGLQVLAVIASLYVTVRVWYLLAGAHPTDTSMRATLSFRRPLGADELLAWAAVTVPMVMMGVSMWGVVVAAAVTTAVVLLAKWAAAAHMSREHGEPLGAAMKRVMRLPDDYDA